MEVMIEQLGFAWAKGGFFVLLREKAGERRCAIFMGFPEAISIASCLGGVEWPRPMTLDLMSNVLEELSGKLKHVEVTEVRDKTFYARLTVESADELIEIDSRPSDAIAMAVRQGCPILVNDELMAEKFPKAGSWKNVSILWPFAETWPPPLDG